jgi:hypothetical protein
MNERVINWLKVAYEVSKAVIYEPGHDMALTRCRKKKKRGKQHGRNSTIHR